MQPVIAPIISVLDAIGLNDPTKIASKAPLTAMQKDILAKLQVEISNAAGKVAANLPVKPPVSPPVKRQDIASEFGNLFDEESGSLEPEGFSKRGGAPLDLGSVIEPLLAPVMPILNLIGLNDPTSIPNKAPLTDAQKDVIAKLQAVISSAADKVTANLPVKTPVRREDNVTEFEE
jgi:hypothetical protein